MSKSIISNRKECFVCGTPLNLERHHVFEGFANRQISEREGCWIYLCHLDHNENQKFMKGIHYNKELDLKVKRLCQEVWENERGTREDFIKLFGRSWL